VKSLASKLSAEVIESLRVSDVASQASGATNNTKEHPPNRALSRPSLRDEEGQSRGWNSFLLTASCGQSSL